jgi:myo-inositol-1(or 4)-monophosphatase
VAVVPPRQDATLGEVEFGVVQELRSGARFTATRGGGARAEDPTGGAIPIRPSPTTDLASMFWAGGVRGRPSVPVAIVLERLVDDGAMHGGYFDLGSAAFDLTRIVTGQLDAYIDVGRRIVDEVPATEPAFMRVGRGNLCTNFPYDVAAAALIVEEAGGVVTHADGRPLDGHPAVGSGRNEGLAVIGAASPALHRAILEEVDRGMIRLAGTDLRD